MSAGHKDRSHSRIGPSAAHRWISCPGSVLASEGEGNTSTFFALEGTAAHEFCEFIMNTGRRPGDFEDGRILLNVPKGERNVLPASDNNPAPDDLNIWRINDEMVEAATLYRDTLVELIEPQDMYQWEARLDMSHVHPDLFGTGDAIIYKPRTKHLIVGDFKYGRGIPVDVSKRVWRRNRFIEEFNEQLMTYGIGGYRRFKQYGVERITLLVIQPRAFHRSGQLVRQADVDPFDLELFESDLREYAARTDDPNAEFVAGEHCRFCKIAWRCKTLRTYVHKIINIRLKTGEFVMSKDDLVTPARADKKYLGRVAREVVVIEGWLRAVMQRAHDEAIKGNLPDGMKLVAKRASRRIVDEDGLKFDLDMMGFDTEEYMAPSKLRGVTAIESLVGKDEFAKFDQFVKKQSSGVVLALEDDPRPSIRETRGGAFRTAADD